MKTNELLEKKLKKYSVKQLVEKLEKNKATEEETPIIVSILESRGQDVSKWKKEIVSQQIQDSIDLESWSDDKSDPEIKLSERAQLAQEVDEFVDVLISSHREGVYTEVMKALGGRYESDLDELLDIATVEQMKEALSFKGIKSNKPEVINAIQKAKINNQKAQEKFEKTIKIQKIKKSKKVDTSFAKEINKSVSLKQVVEKVKNQKYTESKEVSGLVLGSIVEFKTSASSKLPNQVISDGVVKKFNYDNAGKEFVQIQSGQFFFWKRSSSVKVL